MGPDVVLINIIIDNQKFAVHDWRMAGVRVRVSGLNVFPIKSCKACRVEEIVVDKYGVVGDRRLMLVDGNNRFVSQRKFPKLETVTVTMEDGGKGMHVTSPCMPRDLRLVLVCEGERVEVTLWESTVMVVDQGDEAASWFTGVGELYCHLVASAEGHRGSGEFSRLVTNLPPSLKGRLPPMQLALADAGPVSVVSEASLSDLNHRLMERTGESEGVPLNRFRMNIEISGCGQPYEEDEWLIVRIGDVPFLCYTAAEVGVIYHVMI